MENVDFRNEKGRGFGLQDVRVQKNKIQKQQQRCRSFSICILWHGWRYIFPPLYKFFSTSPDIIKLINENVKLSNYKKFYDSNIIQNSMQRQNVYKTKRIYIKFSVLI